MLIFFHEEIRLILVKLVQIIFNVFVLVKAEGLEKNNKKKYKFIISTPAFNNLKEKVLHNVLHIIIVMVLPKVCQISMNL